MLILFYIENFVKLGGEGEEVEVDENEHGTKRKGGEGRLTYNTKKMVIVIKCRKTGFLFKLHKFII